ncbi:hypothetical protein BSK49_01085 [Paenibacillus odorifer]|uniref:hypothetical protein n=1 Tax=Paenibacillus odorifer TaxID=189426 RepID=UPI00096C0A53|nr:hypothetical protein [Paenibacillus odorifer]OMD93008.1 hypothetical protein BSK49_01085 [Paenibacillus odorifer]
MPVQITINGENANEAIQEFAVLSAAFTGTVPVAPVAEKHVKNKPQDALKPTETKQEEEKSAEPVTETGAGGDFEVTVEDIRAKAADVGQAGKKDEIKALLGEFKVKTISSVPAEKRAEFLAALEALVE